MLAATEQRVDAKIAQLKQLQAQITACWPSATTPRRSRSPRW